MPVATQRTTKKDIIKIGIADVVIRGDNKGPMIFGESSNTTEKDTATIKTADPKYSMPRWCPAGLTRSQKRKLQRLRAKERQKKEAEKTFNDTHPLYPPPQKKWRPKCNTSGVTMARAHLALRTVITCGRGLGKHIRTWRSCVNQSLLMT
jgi:hypothetical protein